MDMWISKEETVIEGITLRLWSSLKGNHICECISELVNFFTYAFTLNAGGGGRKTSPWLLENPTQGLGTPRVLENSTQAFENSTQAFENPTQGSGKLQNFHKPCDILS